jgi:hypothetical protein
LITKIELLQFYYQTAQVQQMSQQTFSAPSVSVMTQTLTGGSETDRKGVAGGRHWEKALQHRESELFNGLANLDSNSE